MKETKQKTSPSRQTFRKWILVLSFFLLPVTLMYISPVVIVTGAAEGIATGSMLFFIVLFILSLVVARLWCGWLCPMGAWQEICSPVMRRTVKDGWPNYIKYVVTVLWLGTLAYLFVGAGGIRTVDPFFATDHGLSITSLAPLMVAAVIFAILFIVAFIAGRRGFCHLFCPVAGLMIAGRKIRNLFRWPALAFSAEPSRCIDCKKCSQACPMGLDVNAMVRNGDMDSPECIMCASCADICPKGAVTYGLAGKRT